jgi:hypothetical protein
MQSACALLKRRSRCRSPKLLRSHWRKRQSQTHRAPLSWSHRGKKSCWRKRRSQLPPPLSWSHCKAPLSRSQRKKSHRAPLSWSHQRKRRSHPPPLSWSRGKEGNALSQSMTTVVYCFSFFLKNTVDSSRHFSHKRSRFVG